MSFAKNLISIRKRKRISQEELAFIIGVSRQTIYSWEADLNSPTIIMLKKLAEVLEVGTDELLNGYYVERLPCSLGNIKLTFVSDSNEEFTYEEIPNWYVPLKVGESVCFALYDEGKKDYSYAVSVSNEIRLHNKLGFEVAIKEYDRTLEPTDSYSLLVTREADKILFIGRIFYVNGIKNIETFRDRSFLKKWGMDGKYDGTSVIHHAVRNYVLEHNNRRENVLGIHYFDSNKSYIEVFLNQQHESLFWRRYELNRQSKNHITVEGKDYGLFYEVVTTRLIQ